ncbi:MAG: methylmalonyl Co-A mutase-associated GTPase MeaB [Bernardetiaceae bacterium]|nr:methylmalonyl Co-A mutase-associated GTPase MeaB [Bernardetiaceae bacterium]
MRERLSVAAYKDGILEGNRFVLSRAITLIESNLERDAVLSRALIAEILPHTGNSLRIGITGVPGVGKSTFIESFGLMLAALGKKIAILAIDPSSQLSRGSILGDKTRMEALAHHPHAYIRPSAAGKSLGGVARKTREAMLLCEAAGFDTIIIETVGVGQSETLVKNMVDFFLLLMLAGAGDELQGIKRGIMEMADAIAINKADADNLQKAKAAASQYKSALHLFPPTPSGWIPKVKTCSAIEQTGIKDIWKMITEFEQHTQIKGFFQHNRQEQNLSWLHETISEQLEQNFYNNPYIKQELKQKEKLVAQGLKDPITMAQELIKGYQKKVVYNNK